MILKYHLKDIPITIHRINSHNSVIRVSDRRFYFVVSCPASVTNNFIFDYIDKISDKLYSFCNKRKSQFLEGNTILYLGKSYTIKYGDKLAVLDDTLILNRNDPKKSYFSDNKAIINYLYSIVLKYAKYFDISNIKIKLQSCTSVHGTFNRRNKTILISTNIVTYPNHLIEFVIAHELTHIEHNNHSKAFHKKLEKVLPNAVFLRKEIIAYDRHVSEHFAD
jgi:predicted metal-dependent hydrolase